MRFMSCDIINTLKYFLEIFESKNLTCVQGKNISVMPKQLNTSLFRLDEGGVLHDETYGCIDGYTKCSFEDFNAVFWHLLTQEINSPHIP